MSGVVTFSLQSYVDDIPFEFNPKYRTVLVVSDHTLSKTIIRSPSVSSLFQSDTDINEYDTRPIRDILSKAVEWRLFNSSTMFSFEFRSILPWRNRFYWKH